MKSLLITLFFLFSSSIAQAQQLSFDETVKYINDIFPEKRYAFFLAGSNDGPIVKEIVANKNGIVTFYTWAGYVKSTQSAKIASINLFDCAEISIHVNSANQHYLNFEDVDKESICELYVNKQDGERLAKSLLYLKSLCKKPIDPFGN